MREPITEFSQWYQSYDPNGRDGCLDFRGLADCAGTIRRHFQHYKREMDARVEGYHRFEQLADGEVMNTKPDLPNVSSGETAGLVRRVARNLVQNTPNVEVISKFDDESEYGILSRYILLNKIIGVDEYSNEMQQNLFASTKTSFTLGFSCTVPVLRRDATHGWYIHYDSIHYRDVFPEPGCKDIRQATCVFIRRYLTEGEAWALVHSDAPGWDKAALLRMLKNRPPTREHQSTPHQTIKHHGSIPEGYEIITRYTSDGDPFLTFDAREGTLLRIETNKHPLKQHPVFFLVLEKDDMQPLGKSQVELMVGRQDFQDLMLNGAMKLWYRNINPTILGFGVGNAIPNMSPGKYTNISNPNAKLEAFEVNTQTLMQYGSISEQNLGSMVNLIGAPDQQMAVSAGNGMSATPQGVEAQQTVVDTTTNNWQKAIESFFGRYCTYALTLYFAELKSLKGLTVTADTRMKLLEAGFPVEQIDEEGRLEMPFEPLATEYWVRCVPGSLTELEDEKQLRILNQLFVPLSQAMPALAATQDKDMIMQAARAMSYIISKQIQLSGASSAQEIGQLWDGGDADDVSERDKRIGSLEAQISGSITDTDMHLGMQADAIAQLQEQVRLLTENNQLLYQKLGVTDAGSNTSSPEEAPTGPPQRDTAVV